MSERVQMGDWRDSDPYYRAQAYEVPVKGCAGLHTPGVPVEVRDDVVGLHLSKWEGHQESADGMSPRFYHIIGSGWEEYAPGVASAGSDAAVMLSRDDALELYKSLARLLDLEMAPA